MTVAAPSAQTAHQPRRRAQASIAGALTRVYVDGKHHWSSDLQQTLCGLMARKADGVKPGAVECRICMDMAAQEQTSATGVVNESERDQ